MFCPNNVDSLPEFMSTNCPNWGGGGCPPCPPVPYASCSMLNTHYYRNNAANYIYKSAISPSSSSPHGGCSILNTYYYRNNPANYIYKSAISSSSSSPHGSCSMFVQPDPRQFPQAGEHSMLCFLHVHRRVLQSVMQLHLITRSRFSGAGLEIHFFWW